MTYPNQISAVVRIEKATGAPLIVFGADGCYAHIGQHSGIARANTTSPTRAHRTHPRSAPPAPHWCANGMRNRAI